MSERTIQKRMQVVNRTTRGLGAINKYKDSQVVRDLLEFYRLPLTKAVQLLNKKYRVSCQQIADLVFDGEISRQAVQQNYLISDKAEKGETK